MRRRYIITTAKRSASIDINNYLTIEALEDGLTASLSVNDIEYCINGDNNWKTLTAGTTTETINTGQTLSFRGNLTPNSSNGVGTFTISKSCNLKGNCNSLLFGDNASTNYSLSGKNYAFYNLFYNCSTIVNVSENFLPATTLATQCCYGMFQGCTSLVNAPKLPATTLARYCYASMFRNCSSLTTAPELPATTLADSCYYYMFYTCHKLTTAPELPATTLARYCYASMFRNCSSLTTAPELPATTLADYCYHYMFYTCIKLNYIKMLATDISATNCLRDWVYGVASSGTFVKNPEATWDVVGTSGVPSGWRVIFNSEVEESLITFWINQIEGTGHGIKEYAALPYMTWEEWVESEYSFGRFVIEFDGSIAYMETDYPIGWIGDNYDYIYKEDIIQPNATYLIVG